MGARSRGSTLTSRGQAPDGTRAGRVWTLDTLPRFGVLRGPRGGAVLAVVLDLATSSAFFGSSHPKPLEGHSVAMEWNESVQRIGINPVYPPQEDLHVGDIFADIKQSDNEYPTSV